VVRLMGVSELPGPRGDGPLSTRQEQANPE
jgi:hypothetical protein